MDAGVVGLVALVPCVVLVDGAVGGVDVGVARVRILRIPRIRILRIARVLILRIARVRILRIARVRLWLRLMTAATMSSVLILCRIAGLQDFLQQDCRIFCRIAI